MRRGYIGGLREELERRGPKLQKIYYAGKYNLSIFEVILGFCGAFWCCGVIFECFGQN